MLCIGTGSAVNDANRMRFENDEFYMKTEEEMREALSEFPEACDNTVEVAEKIDVVLERDSILPRFPLPEGETEESWFRKHVRGGAWRSAMATPCRQEAWDRYEYEAEHHLAARLSRRTSSLCRNTLPRRAARESASDRAVARLQAPSCTYAMGITDLDPLPNGLLFERFLSPERVEMPDIDVDFEDERRQEVIEHIKEVYGEDHVSGVITFGKLQAKNAVRDAARVLDYPYSVGDRICKMIGDELGITIDKALRRTPT